MQIRVTDTTIEYFELNVVGAEGTSCDGQFVQWGTYCVGAVGFDFFHCLSRMYMNEEATEDA